MNKNTINKYYYKIGNEIHYITDSNNNIKIEKLKEKNKWSSNYYEAGKGYETNLISLIKYRTDFNKWADEIETDINYKKYRSHDDAVLYVFQSKSTKILNELKIEPVIYNEFHFIESCSNGGLISLDYSIKNKEIQTYGYDFSAFYPNLLANFDLQIPIKTGKPQIIKSLNFPLKYGIYKVNITSENPDFYKLFSFSKNNYYTHYSLNWCNKYKEKFNIKISLLEDNALIYENLAETNKIFSCWFKHLSKLKVKYPDNKLIKRLMSSLWGSICQYKREFFDDIDELDISYKNDKDETEYKLLEEIYYKSDCNIKTRYSVIKSNSPYTNCLARLKPFLTSYARLQMAEMIIEEDIIKDIIRIHTDNVCLSKPHNFKHLVYYPIEEAKTTNLTKWYSANTSDIYCNICKKWILQTEKSNHKH
jgi:hypothetical protein